MSNYPEDKDPDPVDPNQPYGSETPDSRQQQPTNQPPPGSGKQPAYNPFPEGAPPHGYPPEHPATRVPPPPPYAPAGPEPYHQPGQYPHVQNMHGFPDQYSPYGHPHQVDQEPKPAPPDPENEKSILPLTLLAWLVVIAGTIVMFGMTADEQLNPPAGEFGNASKGELMQTNLQAKMLLGQKVLDPSSSTTQNLDAVLDTGPPEARYCFSIMLNEFSGNDAAIEHLEKTDSLIAIEQYPLTDDQKRLREIVGTVLDNHSLGDFETGSLPKPDQEFLVSKLGYCGRLLLAHPEAVDKANRTQLTSESMTSIIIFAVGVLAMIAGFFAGFVLIIVYIIQLSSGNLRGHFHSPRGSGGVYIETFALWLAIFVGGQIGAGALLQDKLGDVGMMFVLVGVFFGSLIALLWPVIRGIPFSRVREDIGWRFGNPFVEGGLGASSYLAMLPAMAVGLLFAILIMGLMAKLTSGTGSEFSNAGPQGHPIQEQVAEGNPILFLGVFLTACVAAPIVEETMFRGVLYRHLRESSWKWGKPMSIIVSALISSLIFAAIHPQGIFGIPILTTLAIGFCLAREWRDSLVAPMLMHAINNSLVTCLLFAMM